MYFISYILKGCKNIWENNRLISNQQLKEQPDIRELKILSNQNKEDLEEKIHFQSISEIFFFFLILDLAFIKKIWLF